MIKNQKSELLLPVGNMNMCLAAIHNGADAIYVGMPEFNARGRTVDFSIDELKDIIETCHLYGVKVNLAFNVVIFEEELPQVVELLKKILPLHPDAIIVQDVGLAKLIREISPQQVVHGSTQMTVTNHEAMSLLADLDIKRFVLGREVSLSEMKAIKEKTDKELEVFVHGALCVAYSGQCFTSESIGGRSANRGQCAQSCRFEYELFIDGNKKDLGDKKYLVSPKDLCGIAQIPELIELGIDSFKVEGRLKTPEYVASAAKNYREAIDTKLSVKKIEEAKREMSLTYSRGFFTGWLNGVDHQQLVEGTYGAHRGLEIGTITDVFPKSVKINSSYDKLKKGDGILFAGQKGQKKLEHGGLLYDVKKDRDLYELFFSREFDFKKLSRGLKVYFNSDAQIEKELNSSYTDKNLKKRIPLELIVDATVGEVLKVKARDGENEIEVTSTAPVEKALDRPLSKKDLAMELGALGSTCFILHNLILHADEKFFIHQKELKVMRREFTEKLMLARIKRPQLEIKNIQLKATDHHSGKASNRLNILLREFSQVGDFIAFADKLKDVLGIVYLDYEFGKDYAQSVSMLREKGIKTGIATTRILKPNEYHNFKIIERANPDVILCRNLGAVYYFRDKTFALRGDFSLNVTNSITADYFLGKNLETVCASYDLNAKQLSDLITNTPSGKLEATIHQYMPSFHMEHCVFAAFMSSGSSFRDCGKPCEEHRVELKDQFGHYHQIKADQECRNTMFNATSQSAGVHIEQWMKLGLSEFRFEALYERGHELQAKILSYADLVRGKALNEDLMKKLGVLEKYGLSDGALTKKEYKDRKRNA